MQLWQKVIILVYAFFSLFGLVKGYLETKNKKNAYGDSLILYLIGAFVWADAVVFGIFWIFVSVTVLLLDSWALFLLIISVFWLVRSVGETIYWFNQQFSKINRNPPENYLIYKIFQNDSVWFVYQIFWQCMTVVSIVASIYFAKLWLGS
jgi:hypothetical protein